MGQFRNETNRGLGPEVVNFGQMRDAIFATIFYRNFPYDSGPCVVYIAYGTK
jgi:hypothetical protein